MLHINYYILHVKFIHAHPRYVIDEDFEYSAFLLADGYFFQNSTQSVEKYVIQFEEVLTRHIFIRCVDIAYPLA